MLRTTSSAVPLEWLVRLRWFFLGGQLIAILLASWAFSADLHRLPLALALGISAASNLLLYARSRSEESTSTAGVMGGILILDTALLTVVLAASGGATNPFTVLFLVYITLSAVVLNAGWTAAVAVMSVAGFGILFLLTPTGAAHSMHADHAQAGFNEHLQGMWAAFVLATVLTAFFVGRISRWLAEQREQIATLREASARNARLAALTTLAAGAAHELNSPLGTIALAAHEANRHSESLAGTESISEDLRLILLEVDRCQDILHRLAAQADESADGGRPVTLAELSQLIADYLGPEKCKRVELHTANQAGTATLPSSQIVPAAVALIQNALDAVPIDELVQVDIRCEKGELHIDVSDTGPGIAPELLDKIGEPFFTTKEPGVGLGLGFFLARAVVESCGGELSIQSSIGVGTHASICLPVIKSKGTL